MSGRATRCKPKERMPLSRRAFVDIIRTCSFNVSRKKTTLFRSFLSSAIEDKNEPDGICISCYCTALIDRIEFNGLDRLDSVCETNIGTLETTDEICMVSRVFSFCWHRDAPFLTSRLTYPNDLRAEDNNKHRANNDIRGRTAPYSSSRRAHLVCVHMRMCIQLSVILSRSLDWGVGMAHMTE